jgi:hypothetical protein
MFSDQLRDVTPWRCSETPFFLSIPLGLRDGSSVLPNHYKDITIIILDNTHRPVFYLKQNFIVRGQGLSMSIGSNWVGSTKRRSHIPVFEKLCFRQTSERW